MLSGCLYSSIDGLFFDLFFECPIDVNYSYVPEAPCTRMLLSASGGTQKSKRRRRRPTSKFLLPSRPNSECHVSRPPRLSESDTLALCRSVGRCPERERPSPGLSVPRFRCFYDGYTARGIHRPPADDDGRFESLMSFALPISSPLRGHFRNRCTQ